MELFEKLYQEYNDDIRYFLLRLTGYERDLADELVQETFYQAIISFHRFRGECNMKSWLYRIAKNQYFNALRARKKSRSVPLDEKTAVSEALSSDPERQLNEKELLTLSLEIIRAMEEKTRDVMIYRIFSEMPHGQIAELLHISESSAKVIYMRGRQKLQKILREDHGYEI